LEVVLRQASAVVYKPNILLNKIGVGAQREGVEPSAALEAFERWLGRSPLIAFNGAFDEKLIARAMRSTLGRHLPSPWLDLEHVAEAALPDVRAPPRRVDGAFRRYLRRAPSGCGRRVRHR